MGKESKKFKKLSMAHHRLHNRAEQANSVNTWYPTKTDKCSSRIPTSGWISNRCRRTTLTSTITMKTGRSQSIKRRPHTHKSVPILHLLNVTRLIKMNMKISSIHSHLRKNMKLRKHRKIRKRSQTGCRSEVLSHQNHPQTNQHQVRLR